jgi:hypothetical protein
MISGSASSLMIPAIGGSSDLKPDRSNYRWGTRSLLIGSHGGSIRDMAIGRRADVEPGQRFRQNGTVWEVVEVRSIHQIPHAKIVKSDDLTERKLISVSALLGGYELASED